MNDKAESRPEQSHNRIRVGPYLIVVRSDGKLYVGHSNGEGGTFTEAQLLPYIEEFFRENF
jgi:hypothetical protein